jgi:hypothetical protein
VGALTASDNVMLTLIDDPTHLLLPAGMVTAVMLAIPGAGGGGAGSSSSS